MLTTISSSDDASESLPFTGGFTFPFYGQNFSQARVCSNGFLNFGSENNTYNNSSLPKASAPGNLISAFWDDLDTRASGEIYYKQEPDRLIIQYQDVERLGGSGTYTFQVLLYADGSIQLRYKTLTGDTSSCTVGIQDSGKASGLQILYNSSYLRGGMAIEIRNLSEFFTISSMSGSVTAHSIQTLDDLFQAGRLPTAIYYANVSITHDGAGANPQPAIARLEVVIQDSDGDGDGMPDDWEIANGLNPVLNDAAEDLDYDALNNFQEYQAETKPNRFDSDGDLLPDGWEVRYGLNPLNAVGTDGMDGDTEPDGVKNIDELIHGSSPITADTDGDGTGDFQEIEQGSDPNSSSDGGQPPPVEDIALVKLTVGDSSGSHSERYNMVVKGVEGDTRTITHQAKEFGVVSTESYKLRKGAKYEVEIVHTGTKLAFLEAYGFSNYDWKADIQPDGDALLIKKDPHTILTEVIGWPNSTFQIKGKKAEFS